MFQGMCRGQFGDRLLFMFIFREGYTAMQRSEARPSSSVQFESENNVVQCSVTEQNTTLYVLDVLEHNYIWKDDLYRIHSHQKLSYLKSGVRNSSTVSLYINRGQPTPPTLSSNALTSLTH